MNNKNDERYVHYKRIYECFEDEYTFDAKGINVDYILALRYSKNNHIFIEKVPIDKFFDELLSQLKTIYRKSVFKDDPLKIVKLVTDNEIIKFSQDLCIILPEN